MGAAELQALAHDVSVFSRPLRSRHFRSSSTESVNQKALYATSSSEVSTSFLDLNANFGGKC